MLRLIGGEDVKTLLKHTGQVEEGDTFDQALVKVEQGIRKQTNQAVARHKLYTMLRQEDRLFSNWYPKVREQAKRCNFEDYDDVKASRDAILFLTTDQKLQQKILAEDLSYDDTIKYGLALEQSKKKVELINASRGERQETDRVSKLEEEIRFLKAGKGRELQSCDTCTRQTHGTGRCPGKNVECYQCGKTGHFKGSKACKKKDDKKSEDKKDNKSKKKKFKSRKVHDEEDSDSETDSDVGRVKEVDGESNTVGGDKENGEDKAGG